MISGKCHSLQAMTSSDTDDKIKANNKNKVKQGTRKKLLRTDVLRSTSYIPKLDTGDFGKILHLLPFYIFKLQQLT